MKRQGKKIQRPKSITTIGWILIITGGMLMVAAASNLNTDAMQKHIADHVLPAPAYYAITFGGFLIYIISGAGILKGWNWARYLFVTWSLIGVVTKLITVPVKKELLPGLLIFVIIAVFLFRPAVDLHFSRLKEKA